VNGKQARKLRKALKYNIKDQRGTELVQTGVKTKRVFQISQDGEVDAEDRETPIMELHSSESKWTYKKLKADYTALNSVERTIFWRNPVIKKEVIND